MNNNRMVGATGRSPLQNKPQRNALHGTYKTPVVRHESPLRNKPQRNRRSVRLRGYDYSQAGAYFVTVCAQNRECLFGEISDGEMRLNDAGKIVAEEWMKSAEIRDEIELGDWVVMPNHFHGILVINDSVGATGRSPLQNKPQRNALHDTYKTPVVRHESPLRNKPQRNRRSVRLRGYDYSQAGAYFVTVCAQNRECLFGEITDGEMRLNDAGKIVAEEWMKSAEIRDEIELDEWVVMPNHFHGIVIIRCRGDRPVAPTMPGPRPKSIGSLMSGFKSAVTKRINELNNRPGAKLWQRNYYEHIIRNDDELNRLREYIINNPAKWELDRENPMTGGSRTAPTMPEWERS